MNARRNKSIVTAIEASWKQNDYERIIKPILREIFGTSESDEALIVGVGTTPIEDFIVEPEGRLLKALDVRKSINIVLADHEPSEQPVLVYILDDLKIAAGAKIHTNLNLTLRARSIHGTLDILCTAGKDGTAGNSYQGIPASNGADGPPQSGSGSRGRNASDSPFGHKATHGETGPDGFSGEPGEHGKHGEDGGDGGHSNGVVIWVERFESGGELRVQAKGGAAGPGGWGQDGGNGGNGSAGGRGGKGGASSPFHGAANGGAGGRGGNGGSGGNGGNPGRHGRPGDGGFVRAWIPSHQNTQPPADITIDYSAGANENPAQPGKGGAGGSRGPGGRGGQGGSPTPIVHGWGKNGPVGPRGSEGVAGVDAEPVTLYPDGKEFPPDVSAKKHPSAEIEILEPFMNS